MKKGPALAALVLLAIAAGGARVSNAPEEPRPEPPPRPPPAPPRALLAVGWYWYFLEWGLADGRLVAFQMAHPGFHIRKVLGFSEQADQGVIVFELTEPVEWTLPGHPTPAPKGIATELTDLTPPEESSAWKAWATDLATRAGAAVVEYDRLIQQWLDDQLRGP